MAFLMLAKCAESQALRKGWPEDLANAFVDRLVALCAVRELSGRETFRIYGL